MPVWDDVEALARTSIIDRRRFLAGSATLGAAAAFAPALAGSSSAQEARKGGHLTVGLNGASTTDSLNPALYTAIFTQFVGQQVYNQLVEVDGLSGPKPALAASWEAKPGAREWIFKLRRDVTFHNGKTMTPDDVVFSLNYHRDPKSKSAAAVIMAPVVDVVASNKDEVTIRLNQGNADLPQILADFHLCIGPQGTSFTDGIGTGMFVMESFDPGVRFRAKLNPNRWRSDRGFVDSVETIAINDSTARLNALISGRVDIVNRVDPKLVDALSNRAQIFEIAGYAHFCFPMRCQDGPFANPDLRLALKYAVDRPAMVKTVLAGHGQVGNDQPISASSPDHAGTLPQYAFDPDKARFHFKKSGFAGPVVLDVAEIAFSGAVDAALLLAQSAESAGIEVKVNRVSSDGYWDGTWMKSNFCAAYWEGRSTADQMLTTVYTSDAAWNESYWKRPEFDRLLVAARGELDATKRKAMYAELQMIIHDDGGELIPMFNNTIDAGSRRVRGFVPSPVAQMSGFRAAEKVWLEA